MNSPLLKKEKKENEEKENENKENCPEKENKEKNIENESKENSPDDKKENSPENENGEKSPENENKDYPILIKRITKKTPEELSISYDISPLEKELIEKEEEKTELLKLIKNILLSCNISYFIYITNKIFGYLKSLLFYNLFYFLLLKFFFNFLNKGKKEENTEIEAALWKRLILFNLPELIIIFYYHKKRFLKNHRAIVKLYSYLNERISYIFNKQPNNNYICKINQRGYDIYLYKKEDQQNITDLYTNNEEDLSKDTFFNSVIAYSNAEFGDFDFNNLEKNEEELYQDIFTLINDIEKKIKDSHSTIKAISSFGRNLSFSNSVKYNVLYAIGLKLASFLVDEIYLNNYACKTQRKILIEEKTKEFNKKHMEEGYFLSLNEYVILLFKIKDNYKSFDDNYWVVYNQSQNLLKKYFN